MVKKIFITHILLLLLYMFFLKCSKVIHHKGTDLATPLNKIVIYNKYKLDICPEKCKVMHLQESFPNSPKLTFVCNIEC